VKTPNTAGVFLKLETRKYRTLSVEKSGYCLLIDIPNRSWDASSVLQLAVDIADVSEQIAWMEDARTVGILFDGNILDPGAGITAGEAESFRLTQPVGELKLPVIAAIRGDALGLGLELALACDIRIGTEGAHFGLPQVCEGTMPSNGGTQRLARLIGPSRAMHMILTGETIDSGEALRIGLLNRIVEGNSLADTAMDMAREMATKSPLSIGFAKEALYSGTDLTLDQGLSKELDLYLQLFGTQDRVEGVTAFRERRKPDFIGK